jgi:carbamoyl-phosphate synthase large subunit
LPNKPKKVLIIGSGPIIIGQAAEFDYAGTQACKAMREEGVISVLVNSNPATIMTDEEVADIVYIEPLTLDSLTRIIEQERPDGILPTLGGQVGLNLAVELADAGVLEKYNVRCLGTPIQTIRNASERDLFKNLLISIGEPVLESAIANNLEEAIEAAKRIGLPLIIRPSYTLGGTGGGIANTWEEMEEVCRSGIAASPIHQVLLEKSVAGWKELEYEVMRDSANNCITVCNMENLDPMGVHTGDSIVIAPSQTLTNKEYQMLRSASLNIIRALGIEGGCNVQYALHPNPPDRDGLTPYFVIEVNPRVSRSSALASKATGYPIARVAGKIAVGKHLDEIPNAVTGKTIAAFEPALDYVVVKIPRWPFDKFASGDRVIGTQMKATGEVMAIDRTFEAALQKAVRSLEFGKRTLLWEDSKWELTRDISSYPLYPNDLRLWAIMAALRRGIDPLAISQRTGYDMWFISKFIKIVEMEKQLLSKPLTPELMLEAKKLGFSDVQIGTLADRLPDQVREQRNNWNIKPVYKMVDTCAAEFDAETPYFYSSYETENEAEPLKGIKAVVIGSGPIRIGQGIEFDYCSVHSSWALRDSGYKSIMVNSNPETVSTDFDTSSRLYFEALDEESIRDILENENGNVVNNLSSSRFTPAIVQFGGQTAINLANPLSRSRTPILGTSSENIDLSENRRLFEEVLAAMGIPQPPGSGVTTVDEALTEAKLIGYPVMVRPSYVLGGRAMEIVHNATELVRYMSLAIELDSKHPILIDKYLQGKECEVDAICDGVDVLIPGIMEHIERAGVHSGDALAVYPGVNLSESEVETMVDYAIRIGRRLNIQGLMNVQFIVMPGVEDQPSTVYVLEVNSRASRTVPFISKVTGVPMVKIATRVMVGQSLKQQGYFTGLWPKQGLIAIKAPVFSMSKLTGVDTYLGPEMKSTGEVMGIDYNFDAALAKALISAGLMLPPEGGILLSIADKDKPEALPIIRKLSQIGYRLYATEGTAAMIEAAGLTVNITTKKLHEGHPNVLDVIMDGSANAVINTVTGGAVSLRDGFQIRRTAAERRIPCFTSLDTAGAAVRAIFKGEMKYSIQPVSSYRNKDNPVTGR